MRFTQYTFTAVFFLILCQLTIPSFGQMGISFNLKKPKEFEERTLRSERSEEKKFTLPKRLIQNTVTHYNYYFNANNKINDVLEKAKTAFKDDYSLLLPFYNYSLDVTAQDSIQLDSITYKSSTGIALHDLRNDWVDNLYLLWGAAYYLRKDFDSAYLMFQFINYAFAPKEKDGYYKTIGSGMDGNKASSIATKEKTSLPRKIFAEPPSRNDAFIWQIRNFLAQDQLAEAASLIVTLKNDPNFPKRLKNDLHEVQAYWFYKQNMWDSAASHLTEALDNATNQQEKARWEYLAAQLYEMTGDYKSAEKYYAKVISHNTDPIMDIYARLYSIRVNKDGGEKSIEKNVAELVKMAKRDKYEDYRDIIYYMAAQMQLEGNNIDEALALLLKSTQVASNNPAQRNRAFLKMAEVAFERKLYRQAYNFYDSLKLDDPTLKDVELITSRKKMLGTLAANIEIAERQDSLQRIALMPEDERKDFVKKLTKQLRKQQGLKEEAPLTTGSPFVTPTAPTLFPSVGEKGEWYFYNAASRARGQGDFKARWGNRPNVDNWRRGATIQAGAQTVINVPQGSNKNPMGNNSQPGTASAGTELSFDGLYANLPLTPDLLKKSNDSLQAALFEMGKAYVQDIEDCSAATTTLEGLRSRFPQFEKMDEVLFNLYYCYNKNGETAKAAAIKKLMSEQYANSNFTTIVTTGKNPKSTSATTDATKTYEKVYDLFIEGNFSEAVAQKKTADSLYGKNFWTPQLLYIEAIYYIKQRDDSIAKNVLNSIVSQFAGTPLAAKATRLLDVLGRRKQIEDELTNLVVNRQPVDTTTIWLPAVNPMAVNNKPAQDTTTKKLPPPVTVNTNPLPKDSTSNKPVVKINAPYTYSATDPYYVVLILTKVDPVFMNEAKNAFMRYNKDAFYNKTFAAELLEIDAENRLLLLSPFKDAQEAVAYVESVRPKTATEIIPWLKGGKYSFAILTNNNLNILKVNKDIENYKAFLNQHLPGKF